MVSLSSGRDSGSRASRSHTSGDEMPTRSNDVAKADRSEFRRDVEAFMAQVPAGFVTTYGDLAALAGHPYAARIVGGMAHYGDPSLPWHRLVNRFGGLAAGYHGGRRAQAEALASEGVECENDIVINFETKRWRPL